MISTYAVDLQKYLVNLEIPCGSKEYKQLVNCGIYVKYKELAQCFKIPHGLRRRLLVFINTQKHLRKHDFH